MDIQSSLKEASLTSGHASCNGHKDVTPSSLYCGIQSAASAAAQPTRNPSKESHFLCNSTPEIALTTTRDRVPAIFQEFNISRGYRLVGQSWLYYFRSLFQAHNELLNVWTHLVGAAWLCFTTCAMWREFGDPRLTYRPDLTVATLLSAFSIMLHLVSSLAHLLHNRSEAVHCFVFYCDNAAAGLTAFFVNAVGFYFYSTRDYFHSLNGCPFLTVQALGATVFPLCMSWALARYRRRYSWKTAVLVFGPAGLYVLWGLSPAFHRIHLLLTGRVDDVGFSSLSWTAAVDFLRLHHTTHLLSFFVAVAFYMSYFPEVCWPGCFDIVGHSHQWFHCFSTLSHWLQLRAVRIDISRDSPELFSKRVESSDMVMRQIAVTVALVVLVDACVVIYLLRSFKYSSCGDDGDAGEASFGTDISSRNGPRRHHHLQCQQLKCCDSLSIKKTS